MHYIGWLMTQGKMPYRDVFDMNMPVTYWVHWALIRIAGTGDLPFRIFDLCVTAMISLLIFAISRPAGWFAAALGATVFAFYQISGGPLNMGQRDLIFTVPFLAAFYGVLRIVDNAERPIAWAIIAGTLYGAAAGIKPLAGAYVVFIVILLAATPFGGRRQKLRVVAALIASSAVVPAIALGWLCRAGALGDFVALLTQYLPLYAKIDRDRNTLAYLISYRFLMWMRTARVAWAVSVVMALWQAAVLLRQGSRRSILFVSLLGYGAFHYLAQGKGWDYHLRPFVAAMCILTPQLVERQLQSRAIWVRAGVVCAMLASLAIMWNFARVELQEAAEPMARVAREDGLAQLLRSRLQPGQTVQILDSTDGGAAVLLKARALLATPIMYDFQVLAHDPAIPIVAKLRSRLMDGMREHPPQFILIFARGYPTSGFERIERFPTLNDWISAHYTLDRDDPAWCRMYVLKAAAAEK